MATAIALPDRFARTPRGREVQEAIGKVQASAAARARAARAAMSRAETRATIAAGVSPIVGAAVAAQADRMLPQLFGYDASLVAGVVFTGFGLVQESPAIAGVGAGMLARHAYNLSASFGG